MNLGIANLILSSNINIFGDYVDEIAAGNALLYNATKCRAYWNFTQLVGNEDEALVTVPDLTGNGWVLDNGAGILTPKLGKILIANRPISCLKANTQSGVKQAMKTTAVATNLLNANLEVWFLVALTDGQNAGLNILCGTADSATRQFNIRVNADGTVGYEYAANATTLSTLTSSGTSIEDGFTGLTLIRSVFNFDTDTITPYINGVQGTSVVASGNALSLWNPANFISTKGFGVGGKWDGTNFAADVSSQYKYILKSAITNILTNTEAINVSLSMMNI